MTSFAGVAGSMTMMAFTRMTFSCYVKLDQIHIMDSRIRGNDKLCGNDNIYGDDTLSKNICNKIQDSKR